MSQLKVALNYTGLLRSWKQCKGNHYENIWQGNDCNLFFFSDKNPLQNMEAREIDYVYNHEFEFNQDENVDWYPNPWALHRYDSNKAPENTVAQTFRQWHCGMIGFHLIPKGYDIYVRIRPDTVFSGGLNFADYDCSGKTIYIPQGLDFGGINDTFAFGNHEVMKIYYSVYLNCHDLWHEGHRFHSEGMQLANLNKHGINIVRIGTPQITIIR